MKEQNEKSVCADGAQKCGSDTPHEQHQKGLSIEPPPKDMGEEALYRVVYVIDVNAADVQEAAQYTHRIMTDPDSMAPVLHILDADGCETTVDLSVESSAQKTMPQPEGSDEQVRRFVASCATICPKCGGQNLFFKAMNVDGQSAYQQASCSDCEARFFAIYRLVGYGLYHGDEAEIHTVVEDFGEVNS